ncbi:MAG: glycosyltransferase [Candidatus Krumholzibacteriota bacterium]|nr:glycosyltransferase [Candidatus Krumholzibacteriota bacterium]
MENIIKAVHILAPMANYGKERWLLAFLKNIDRTRTEPEILLLSSEKNPEISSHLDAIGIKFITLDSSARFSFRDIRKIREIIIGSKADLIHSHDYKSDIYGILAAGRLPVKKVSTPHGWCAAGDRKVGLYEKIDRVFLRHFDAVVPLSEKMALTLKGVSSRRLCVINNFVDLEGIPAPGEGDPLLITYMGRLVGLKRVEDLIQALGLVKNRDTRLQIIGDGPMRGELESLAGRLSLTERIHFLGHRDDSLDLLNRSRIMVLPSLTEGISRSVMEAMAMKKVIISTNIPGINELIRDKENGYLVGTKDPSAIAETIDFIYENMDRAMAAAEKAKAAVENDFSAAKVVKDYERLYASLI